jgi:hypothetical protein
MEHRGVAKQPGTVQPAKVVRTERRTEVRCPDHGHLLGVMTDEGQLVIKCRRRELVGVELPRTDSDS